jgi:hypothetical protein
LDLVINELEKVTVKVLDKTFTLVVPSVKHTRAFTAAMKEALDSKNDDKTFDIIKDYLLPLGMPEDAFEDLQISVLLKICGMLNKAKKN